jgi:hypothetical protein
MRFTVPPRRTSCHAAVMADRLVPTRWFVPSSIVTGRSVVVRSVRHGTPSAVVSYWIPPESVSTTAAAHIRPTNSR